MVVLGGGGVVFDFSGKFSGVLWWWWLFLENEDRDGFFVVILSGVGV